MNHKLVAITGALMLSLGACTPASYNLSNDIDTEGNRYFKTVGEDWCDE